MKLELKHLAPYLPYGLKVETNHGTTALFMCGDDESENSEEVWCSNKRCYYFNQIKPILRPLSDLTEVINKSISDSKLDWIDLQLTDFDIDILREFSKGEIGNGVIPYKSVKVLLKYNFDIFGLIDKGLAIDINTLNKEQ